LPNEDVRPGKFCRVHGFHLVNAALTDRFFDERSITRVGEMVMKRSAGESAGAAKSNNAEFYWRYCWMRVVRSPASPWRSIEYCQAKNSSTVSV
jgi:hypothetical protein